MQHNNIGIIINTSNVRFKNGFFDLFKKILSLPLHFFLLNTIKKNE